MRQIAVRSASARLQYTGLHCSSEQALKVRLPQAVKGNVAILHSYKFYGYTRGSSVSLEQEKLAYMYHPGNNKERGLKLQRRQE